MSELELNSSRLWGSYIAGADTDDAIALQHPHLNTLTLAKISMDFPSSNSMLLFSEQLSHRLHKLRSLAKGNLHSPLQDEILENYST